MCKTIRSSLSLETSIRFNAEFKSACSAVVAGLLKRVVPLLVMYANATKLKTITDSVVMFVLKFMVVDAGGDFTSIENYTQEKISLYKTL